MAPARVLTGMMMMGAMLQLCGCASGTMSSTQSRQTTSGGATGLALADVTGAVHHPLETQGDSAVVLVFIASDCPISNGYAPEINRICQAYALSHIRFYLVQVDTDMSDADAAQHARDFAYPCPVLLDRRHELVRRLGATVTPEAFVIAPGGAVAYRGRIDDRYVDLGKSRVVPTTHDLRDALNALLDGNAPPVAQTKAIGCPI
jgi:thiol-disulfide isomerase/thioredoxin